MARAAVSRAGSARTCGRRADTPVCYNAGMPCASAVSVRRRGGGLVAALLLAAALAPAAASAAVPDPPTDDIAPTAVQEDALADGPYGMAVGDRNGDGLRDAFVARWYSGDVLIRQGTAGGGPGAGRMDDDVIAPVGGHPREVEAADWDGDGLDDAVTLLGDGALRVWTGGLGTVSVTVPLGLNLDTGDIDGDDLPDAVVARQDSTVHVVRNDTLPFGAALMSDAGEIPVCATPTDVELVDLTGDRKLDLVVACQSQAVVQVRPGDGAGGFGDAVSSPAGTAPYRLESGDVDGDGVADLAVTGTGSVRILRGVRGSAALGAPATYAVAGAPRRPLLADLDDDGRLDLAGTTTSANGIGFRLNRGDGVFGSERRVEWTFDAWDMGVADVTGDGRQDFVAIAFSGDAFAVWEGRPAPDPVVELSGLGVGVYEGAAGVMLDPAARILGRADAEALALTVTIASGRAGDDVLSATPAAPIAAAWNGATGVLTLTALTPQPVAAWRAALRTVRFAHVAAATGGATGGRRGVRVQLDALPSASRSIDVWLRPPDAGDVALTGVPVAGETLSLHAGPWGGTPPVALRVTLERCAAGGGRCASLGVAPPYAIRAADVGSQLRARVVGTGPDGSFATAFSARTEPIRLLAAPRLLSGPAGETADTAVEVAFGGEDGATFACMLDGGAELPCVSPVRYAGLAVGAHAVGVVQVLPSGARSTAAVRVFSVTAPVVPRPPEEPPRPPTDVPRTPTTPTDTPRPPALEPRRPVGPTLVAPRRTSAAELRRGLTVRVLNVARGARATATLASGKRRVVASSLRATHAGTLQLRLRPAGAALARLGRRGTLGLSVTIAAPRAKRVKLAARIAYRR